MISEQTNRKHDLRVWLCALFYDDSNRGTQVEDSGGIQDTTERSLEKTVQEMPTF